MPKRRRPTGVLVVAALLGAALAATGGPSAVAAPGAPAAFDPGSQPATVTATVDVRAGLGTVPTTGLGVNHAIWDPMLGSEETNTLLRDAGVQTVRYPGGSYADIYHWRDHTAPGGYVAPDTDFDTFMNGARTIGAQPIVIANYGSGTAQEAADWVEYANVTRKYGVKYWEIGNEIYGNGHYSGAWETDQHEDKSPAAYAKGVVEYSKAMKAVDPTVKIGAVVTTPGNWPDGLVGSGDDGTWNKVVLSIAGPAIDFVVLHWYPGGDTAARALAKPEQVVDVAQQARQQITRFAGAGSERIGISLTEINVGVGMNTQPAALFAADLYPALWAAGVFTVNWWDVHNGIGTVSTVAGQTDYGDYGMLSSGGCVSDKSVCEPANNTPFAPYHALHLLGNITHPGDQVVDVATSDPLVRGHAFRYRNGDLAVLLLNEDPDAAKQVQLRYPGFLPAKGRPLVTRYLNGASGPVSAHAGTTTSQILEPYSLNAFVLHPVRRGPVPSAPREVKVSAVTDTTATVAWTPSGPGHRAPAASPTTAGTEAVAGTEAAADTGLRTKAGHRSDRLYEVYVRDATGSHLVGRTSGTSLAVKGLKAATDYTVTVLTRQSNGATSWSTPAVAFTTGSPQGSTCAVRVTDANNWGNGYVGNIDITNRGTEPVTGWKLAFAFPRSWISFGSGWNATWTADGTQVTASDPNATIAPGTTVSIGYVGNFTGPNILPRLFSLNGSVCTTM